MEKFSIKKSSPNTLPNYREGICDFFFNPQVTTELETEERDQVRIKRSFNI